MCLVSKNFLAIALSVLYKSIDLPDYCTNSKEFSSLSKSRVLQHVQNIHLDQSFRWTQDKTREILTRGDRKSENCAGCGANVHGDTDAHGPLARLLPKLRKDTLRVFEYDRQTIIPTYKQIRYLWRTQTQLTNLQLDTDLAFNPGTMKEAVNALRSLRSINRVYLSIGLETDMASFAHLFASLNYTKLEEVCFILREGQMLDYILFACYFPSNLRRMSLVLVTLPTSQIVQLDSWPGLKELKLLDCDKIIPTLFDFLSPRLTTLAFRDIHHGYSCNRGKERLRALISMIRRSSTLETLIIDTHDSYRTDRGLVESLRFHASTLRSLMISCIPINDKKRHDTDLLVLEGARHCKNLEELVLHIPFKHTMETCKVSDR